MQRSTPSLTPTRPPKAPFWARAWWFAEQRWNRVRTRRELTRVRHLSTEPSASRPTADVVVSLTTHGARFQSVHVTVASIMGGTLRPARIILWVDDPSLFAAPSEPLRELLRDGLELKLCENFGPHTKYYPTVRELSPEGAHVIVTADDDIIYPARWLEVLMSAWLSEPDLIHAYRCHQIRFARDGLFAPYSTWTPAVSKRPRSSNFFTGVSGVLYPPQMTKALREAGEAFMLYAPKADDIWLNHVALKTGHRTRQINVLPKHYPVVPGSQAETLVSSNIAGIGNDQQISSTYAAADMRAIRDDRRPTTHAVAGHSASAGRKKSAR
jgi:hypothetical protein